MKNFIRNLLFGLAAVFLVLASEQSILGDFSQKGTQLVLAEDGSVEYEGSEPLDSEGDDGSVEYEGSEPLPVSAPAPVAPAPAPVVSAPAAPAGPTCTPNDQIDTTQDCVGDQWCTFNIWKGADCSTGRGGAYGCQRVEGRCGVSAPPPAAVSGPGSPSISGSSFCERSSPGITWNWSLPSNADSFDVNIPGSAFSNNPASSSFRSYTARNLVAGQTHNASIVVRNSAGANSATATVTALACGVSQPSAGSLPACPVKGQSGTQEVCPGTWAYDSCTTTQLSDGRIRYDCRYSQNSNCVGDPVFCPASVSVSQCTPRFLRQDEECVGSSLCTFKIHQRSDCSTEKRGPFDCSRSSLCERDGRRDRRVTEGRRGPQGPAGPAGAPGAPGAAGGAGVTQSVTQSVTQTVNVEREAVREVFVGGNVGIATTGGQVLAVQELPKTGLPILGWAALAFIPTGFGLRRLGYVKKENENNPGYIWEERQFKAGS